MTKLLQNQQRWRVDSTEVGRKSGPKIPRRVDLPKIARVKGSFAFFGELERLKPGIVANEAKMSELAQQKIVPMMIKSAPNQNSAGNDILFGQV